MPTTPPSAPGSCPTSRHRCGSCRRSGPAPKASTTTSPGPADLDAWLTAVGIDRHGAKATEYELRSAIRLRDAVRRLAAHATGDDRPAAASAIAHLDEAVTVLNEHAAKLPPPAIATSPSGLRRAREAPASDVTIGLADIAQQAVALLADRGDQLLACHAPGCVLYFVKSHPRREWRSVARGNIREGRAGPRPR